MSDIYISDEVKEELNKWIQVQPNPDNEKLVLNQLNKVNQYLTKWCEDFDRELIDALHKLAEDNK